MKREKLLTGEIIGSEIEIIRSNNKDSVGICGTVVDETRSTIRIETKKGEKTILKENNDFKIGGTIIKGSQFASRPEERIKKWLKNRR